MCGEYVQRTGQYFYISNSNPLIIETNNFNSNLLRKCHPKLEAQTLCYQIMYLKVNLKQINFLICNNTSLTNYDIFNTFKLSIIYFRDLQLPCHEVNHYTYFVFEMSLIITCYTAYSYIRLINLSKRIYRLLLILIVHHTCYTYISMFRLYRKVILYIMHFVRDVFKLPHSYSRSIGHLKSFNTIPVNNYSYKTNNSINTLTTYNYFNIPRINIVVVPVKPIPLNDFPFNDMTDESLRTEFTIRNAIDSGIDLSVPLNLIHDLDHIDHSTLGDIDPDTNILSNINTSICS